MKYYIEITLLTDEEVHLGFLWQKLYQQIHLALVELKTEENRSHIAVSFPQYGNKEFPLGNKLRLLSETQEQLIQLNVQQWLDRLTDYIHCTSIKKVPSSVSQFACFKRRQFDTNINRLARRRVKRKKNTLEEALKYYAGFTDKESNLPFINILSLSSGKENNVTDNKKFRLFIEKEIKKSPLHGDFTCYGLSNRDKKQSTVPIF